MLLLLSASQGAQPLWNDHFCLWFWKADSIALILSLLPLAHQITLWNLDYILLNLKETVVPPSIVLSAT